MIECYLASGLISFMLFRLRMTVDECLEVYKLIGGKVFGNPGPLVTVRILWHDIA